MKTKIYNVGQILSVLTAVALGVVWFMAQNSFMDIPNSNVVMVLAVSVGAFAVGILCFRSLVYNKNDYVLLEQFPWHDKCVSIIGAILVFSSAISVSIIGSLAIITPIYTVMTGVFS